MKRSILLVTALSGVEQRATALEQQLDLQVEVAATRDRAHALLREQAYAAIVIDEGFAESDPRGADLLWKMAGLAIPLQVNFALTGSARLVRDLRAALARREQEQALAMRAAFSTMETELRSTVTGLLLHLQLALAEPAGSAHLQPKLKLMVELAGNLKQRLERAQS
ncbi:MAG: hypothetical protein ACR2JE_06005 [Acidobacteriaceae bacterium]